MYYAHFVYSYYSKFTGKISFKYNVMCYIALLCKLVSYLIRQLCFLDDWDCISYWCSETVDISMTSTMSIITLLIVHIYSTEYV